jgi:bifunctional NMN adenylyltransferase/nudix hydrolase
MGNYPYDIIVFLHRGQPLHKAHKKIYDRSLALSRHVIPVYGSHRKAPDTYNPWSSKERIEMSKLCFDAEDLERLHYAVVTDHPYKNSVWLAEVHTKVRETIQKLYPEHTGWSDRDIGKNFSNLKIGIIGYNKDDTTDYLTWFPQWEFIDTAEFSHGVSATLIRNSYFMEMVDFGKFTNDVKSKKFLNSKTLKEAIEQASGYNWRKNIPEPVVKYLEDFRVKHPERCENIVSEFVSNLMKKSFKEDYPYPIIENTVDAVVMKNAHVLMVRRGGNPGRGLWALPGGFINEYEDKFDAVIRELKEETNINFFYNQNFTKANQLIKTEEELIKSCVGDNEFGHPRRSTRGRVITRAYHFQLPEGGEFPYVKGGDDAADARWFPVAELFHMREMIFEDHMDIIEFFTWK